MENNSYSNIWNLILGSDWAIVPEKLEAILDLMKARSSGIRFTTEEIAEKVGEKKEVVKAGILYETREDAIVNQNSRSRKKVAVLQMYGVVAQRMDMFLQISGGTSTDTFGKLFDMAVKEPNIGAIVLDIDSPGGSVYGVQELSDRIFRARADDTKVIAVANSMVASAAYWIGSAADELVVTTGGEVGSIGVVAVHTEYSELEKKEGVKSTIIKAGKYKYEGNDIEPLSKEAREGIQKRVDGRYEQFLDAVARNRGTTAEKVKRDYGEGRMVFARDAVSRGMADRVATLDEVLEGLGVGMNPSTKLRAGDASSRMQMAISLLELN